MHWLKRYLYDRISVDIISPTFPVNFWSRMQLLLFVSMATDSRSTLGNVVWAKCWVGLCCVVRIPLMSQRAVPQRHYEIKMDNSIGQLFLMQLH